MYYFPRERSVYQSRLGLASRRGGARAYAADVSNSLHGARWKDDDFRPTCSRALLVECVARQLGV